MFECNTLVAHSNRDTDVGSADAKVHHLPGWYRVIIHTDASCGDGVVGVGYTIRIDGNVHKGSTHFEGHYTSMEAEFLALKEAAHVAARFFPTKEHVFFYTDCQGLVEKMEDVNDTEKWNDRRNRVVEILANGGLYGSNWSVKWVPRERNRDADALAHTARDGVV